MTYLLDAACLRVSKPTDDDQRFYQKIFREECRTSRYFVSHRESEIHALQNGNLERCEVLKIADRVQYQMCFTYQRPREPCCTCGSLLQGITEGIKKQAGQRINSRLFIYVPGIHMLALKNTQRGRHYGNSAARKQEITWTPQRKTMTEGSWRAALRTSSTACACKNKHTRNPTWKNLKEEQVKNVFTSLLLENGLTNKDQHKVVQAYHGGGRVTP